MYKCTRFFLIMLIAATGGCTNQSLKHLPHYQWLTGESEYAAEPYIQVAVALQAMGREHACQQLMSVAKHDEGADQIYVLCRMLFTKRGTNEFREPWIGEPSFLGGTEHSDWPLDPIEVVDGVPFVIVWNFYSMHGQPEPPDWYLNYCMTNCDWSSFKFEVKSNDEMKDALNKLLASPKWKHPLYSQERGILTRQVP